MLEWMSDYKALLWSLGGVSVVIFIASLFIIPALIVRIRPDYFTHELRPPSVWAAYHPVTRIAMLIGKNVLGAVLMIAGVTMLVLPGQGLLTIMVGFMLIDFPGKYRFEKWLVTRSAIRRPINWLRTRAGRMPLEMR